MTKRTDKGTTRIGFVNINGQKNLGRTIPQRAGTDHCQFVYILKCNNCGHKYGSNGSDIFQRKCPSCQGGREGPKLLADEINRATHKNVHLANKIEAEKKEIVDLLRDEITYFKKLKSAIGDIHGHIHSLAVKAAKIYLVSRHRKARTWKISAKYGEGIDIVGIDDYGEMIVAAEVKTTSRSKKETLGRPQRSRIKKDIERLIETDAEHKYLFIIDNKNRKAIEGILKTNKGKNISLVNIFEC